MKEKNLVRIGWVILLITVFLDNILKIDNPLIGGFYLIAVIIFGIIVFKKNK